MLGWNRRSSHPPEALPTPPGLDPVPGFNLVSWWNFGAEGASKWEAAVDDLFAHDFRAVSLIPVRYVDLTTGAISGEQKAPEIAHIAAGVARAKSLGMTVAQFNQIGREVISDPGLRERVSEQAYLYRVASAVNLDKVPLLDDPSSRGILRSTELAASRAAAAAAPQLENVVSEASVPVHPAEGAIRQ